MQNCWLFCHKGQETGGAGKLRTMKYFEKLVKLAVLSKNFYLMSVSNSIQKLWLKMLCFCDTYQNTIQNTKSRTQIQISIKIITLTSPSRASLTVKFFSWGTKLKRDWERSKHHPNYQILPGPFFRVVSWLSSSGWVIWYSNWFCLCLSQVKPV